ncbi:MAG: ABC transporter ATP-binding protein [Microbacterium gubbeenense]
MSRAEQLTDRRASGRIARDRTDPHATEAPASPRASGPVIEARGLRTRIDLPGGTSVDVLRGIDLEVRRGEFVAITGPSGSGKSTLLFTLAGIDRPTSGTVAIDGVDLAGLDERALERLRLERIGFVFQQPHLVDGLTVRENALLPASWRGGAARRRAEAETRERLERLGIAELADRDVAALSGGQRQRAGIARALVNGPTICIADEPTGALDGAAASDVLDVLETLHDDGLTIVLVTHDAAVAARAQRIVRLVDGRVAGATESRE